MMDRNLRMTDTFPDLKNQEIPSERTPEDILQSVNVNIAEPSPK